MENGSAAVQIAHEPEFELGSATVRPAASEVVSAWAEVRLQPRVMQVLVVLAQAHGDVVPRDELVARCWGGISVGEDALNRCIQRLRKLSDEFPDCFRIATIAKVGYRLERCTLAVSQAHAPVPDPKILAVSPTSSGQLWAISPRARWIGFAVVAVVTVGLSASWLSPKRDARPSAAKISIAVAPLQVRAGDLPAHIVQAGLSNDLARAMVASPLQVSVATLGPDGPRSPKRLILDGNAFTVGENLQVQLQLRDGASQDILWARSFAGHAAAADALREQAALKAGAVLNCALHTRQSADETDDVIRLYLSACDDIGDSDPKAALDRLRRLTTLAPRLAQAWAELAATVAITARDVQPGSEAAAYREAAADARHALSLDPHVGLAYFALVVAAPGVDNWARRVFLINKGLQVEPNAAELDNLMGSALLQVGRSAEAVTYLQRAVDLDPLSPVKTVGLIAALTDAGRYEEAEKAIVIASRLWPRDPRIWSRAFLAKARSGDREGALALLADPDRPAMRDLGEVAYWRAWLQYRQHPNKSGRDTVLRLVRKSLRTLEKGEELVPAYKFATLNRNDLAYAMALPAARALNEDHDHLLFSPEVTTFRADPHFMTLAKRVGLVAIWRTTNRWPDFCAAADAPYNCAAAADRAPD